MAERWTALLSRWTEAGLIDAAAAARVRAFEQQRAGTARLHGPIVLALAFGALTIASGVALFVSAHWDAMSPAARFSLVLGLTAAFHLLAALLAARFPALSVTLHAVGTAALGAGIFLAGQVFHLAEHWPTGMALWGAGAAVGWALLRQWPQLALAAVLLPAWLVSEWVAAAGPALLSDHRPVVSSGVFLLALAYFTAVRDRPAQPWRRVLLWIGGIALLPAAAWLAFEAPARDWRAEAASTLDPLLALLGWSAAFGLPLVLALVLHGTGALPIGVAGAWVALLLHLDAWIGDLALYAAWTLAAAGLAAWGLAARRGERVNMGAALFAATVVVFYSSQVMDKLGRSASLLGLGLLFLGGGWLLERLRRRLVRRAREGTA